MATAGTPHIGDSPVNSRNPQEEHLEQVHIVLEAAHDRRDSTSTDDSSLQVQNGSTPPSSASDTEATPKSERRPVSPPVKKEDQQAAQPNSERSLTPSSTVKPDIPDWLKTTDAQQGNETVNTFFPEADTCASLKVQAEGTDVDAKAHVAQATAVQKNDSVGQTVLNAPAIPKFPRKTCTDPEFKAVMEAVAAGNANPDQITVFEEHLHEMWDILKKEVSVASTSPSREVSPHSPLRDPSFRRHLNELNYTVTRHISEAASLRAESAPVSPSADTSYGSPPHVPHLRPNSPKPQSASSESDSQESPQQQTPDSCQSANETSLLSKGKGKELVRNTSQEHDDARELSPKSKAPENLSSSNGKGHARTPTAAGNDPELPQSAAPCPANTHYRDDNRNRQAWPNNSQGRERRPHNRTGMNGGYHQPQHRFNQNNTMPNMGGYPPQQQWFSEEIPRLRHQVAELSNQLRASKEENRDFRANLEKELKQSCVDMNQSILREVYLERMDVVKQLHGIRMKEAELQRRSEKMRIHEDFLSAGQTILKAEHPDLGLYKPDDINRRLLRDDIASEIRHEQHKARAILASKHEELIVREQNLELREMNFATQAEEALREKMRAELEPLIRDRIAKEEVAAREEAFEEGYQRAMEDQAMLSALAQGRPAANIQGHAYLADPSHDEHPYMRGLRIGAKQTTRIQGNTAGPTFVQAESSRLATPFTTPPQQLTAQRKPTMYQEFNGTGPTRDDGQVVLAGQSGMSKPAVEGTHKQDNKVMNGGPVMANAADYGASPGVNLIDF